LDDLNFIEEHIEPGFLLSFGCGYGSELPLARRRGWQVEGYDVDPVNVQRVSREHGVRIHTGDFFDIGLPADHYDCIFADQGLEHLKTPGDYLRDFHRILRPGGILFIAVPNIESISCKLKTLRGKFGLKKNRGDHYASFHHLLYYSPATLKRNLEQRYGFRVLAAQGTPFAGGHDHHQKQLPSTKWRAWAVYALRRRFPFLESTFRLIAEKQPG